MIKELKKELLDLKDEKYRAFSASLLPGVENIIGVRLPVLGKIAKKIAKSDYETFFDENDDEFFELTMLEAMVIGNLKLEFSEVLKLIENFIPKINNWSVCDSFCTRLKIINKNKPETKKFLKKYLSSKNEYELRFAFVVLLNYFIDDDYEFVMNEIIKFNNDKYYAKMAAAWCLSICFAKNFNETLNLVKHNKIHDFTLKKGIMKTKESFRPTVEEKKILGNYFKQKYF